MGRLFDTFRRFDVGTSRRRKAKRFGARAAFHSEGTLRRWTGRPAWSGRLVRNLALLAAAALLTAGGLFLYLAQVFSGLPTLAQLENPAFQLAAVAYTADGKELARYSSENRSWATFERMSPHVVDALVATEDHRYFRHDGIDVFRTVSAVLQSALAKAGVPGFVTQGGSTITQQLARNLYNDQIGFERSVERKLKEMATAMQLEDRYSKREILELYLNTVQFAYNSYGIETAAQTFFGKPAVALTVPESATLVGMLKAITRYNPVRNPENARARRDLVLALMARHGYITPEEYGTFRTDPITAANHSSSITSGPAPHFSQVLKDWLEAWGARSGIDIYSRGLRVHTTIDSRLQQLAGEAVDEQMTGLQAVVDYEWSRASDFYLGDRIDDYLAAANYEPFAYFWQDRADLAREFIGQTAPYRTLLEQGVDSDEAATRLLHDEAFMDSLKTAKSRLQAGLVSIDPRTGYVRVWIGGTAIEQDWNDHVNGTRRQPGSTFKPFVYTAAIDNGWPPSHVLPDRPLTYTGPFTRDPWSPRNFGGTSGGMVSLQRALATSNNLITARVITELVTPSQVAFYARRMGIESPLTPVASLGLGTSDVTLLEMAAAYSTLANGGRYFEPTFVTRIEDVDGNVLFNAEPGPAREVLSSRTAYTVVDMLREAVEQGTAVRLRGPQFRLGAFDLAAKTGTTQDGADGWFMLMHPDLVTGSWVGFNDRRITFRSRFWGQGAHNALFLVGSFFRKAVDDPDVLISRDAFPGSDAYGLGAPTERPAQLPIRVLTPRRDGR